MSVVGCNKIYFAASSCAGCSLVERHIFAMCMENDFKASGCWGLRGWGGNRGKLPVCTAAGVLDLV